MTAAPRVLVLRALGLGDFLTAVPALRAVAAAYPHHHRQLATPGALAPLARLLEGAVDEVIDAAPLAPLAIDAPDVAVNLHGRGPQSHRVLLATHPRRLIGFAHAEVPETSGFPEWREDEHEVTRWCRLLVESGIPADASRLDLPVPPDRPPREVIGATLLHPGAADAARRWPIERWAQVAAAQAATGRRVIVTARGDEIGLARAVAERAELEDAVFAGGDVLMLAALVAAAGRVVVGDTGVAHLATALGTPSVVLFGPTAPARWGPPPSRPQHRVIWKGRTGDPHGRVIDEGLLAIEVADVLEALERLDDVLSGAAR